MMFRNKRELKRRIFYLNLMLKALFYRIKQDKADEKLSFVFINFPKGIKF